MNNINLKKIKNIKFCIDSRELKRSSIFFCLKGKKTDGHNFVNKYIKKNCKFYVKKEFKLRKENRRFEYKLIRTSSPLKSLNNLARLRRDRLSNLIIGITGSCGKTTVKEMLYFFLSHFANTYKSPKSYNNNIGLPLSILNQPINSKYGVYELGMNKIGEIDYLSKILKPQVGVITNIAPAHIGKLKSLNNIFKAKSELIANIQKGGHIILNSDCKYFKKLKKIAKKNKVKIITFGLETKSNYFLKKFHNGYCYIKCNNNIVKFRLKNFSSAYIYNILIALAVINLLNLNIKKIIKKFNNFKEIKGRGNLVKVKNKNKKFSIIDDSYNSNPLSIKHSIQRLNKMDDKKFKNKVIILSEMLELGKYSNKYHLELSKIINKSTVEKVHCIGTKTRITHKNLSIKKRGRFFKNINEFENNLDKLFVDKYLYLFKGSNSTGLNKVLSKRIYNVK